MKKFLGLGRPSASMVVAVAALGVGLAGGASAAGDLITGADIKNGSITGVDIKNGSVRFQDLTPSTRAKLLNADGPAVAGSAGATGAKGDTGAQGEPGREGRDAFTYVTALDGTKGSEGWSAREFTCDASGPNGDARLDGHLVLGQFADGNAFSGGKLNSLNGLKLSEIEALSFSERASGGIDGYNAPYLRLFTDEGGSVIYSPSTQAGGPGSSENWRRHNVTQGSVRYNDDAGETPDITWSEMIAAHGDETVKELRLQAGCAGGYSDGSTAYVDDVLLKANDNVARYDFE